MLLARYASCKKSPVQLTKGQKFECGPCSRRAKSDRRYVGRIESGINQDALLDGHV